MPSHFYPLLSLLLMVLFGSSASAEAYMAGQGGVTLPQPLSGRQLTPPGYPDGTTTTNLALKSSYMYGGKVGHYFQSMPWLAFEAELFTTTPNIKQQPVTITLPPNWHFVATGTRTMTQELTGQSLSVTTWR